MSRFRAILSVALFVVMPVLLGSSAPGCDPTDSTNAACENKTCTLDADCGLGGLCVAKQCYMRHTFCANERWAVNDRGEMMDCGIYKCNELIGECRREADGSEQCAGGFAYDGGSACVSTYVCGPDSEPSDCQRSLEEQNANWANYANRNPKPNYQNTCAKPCAEDCDCGDTEMCYSGKCVPKDNYCMSNDQGQYFSMTRDGAPTYCGGFRCEVVTGQCLNECISSTECAPGLNCSDGTCVIPGISG